MIALAIGIILGVIVFRFWQAGVVLGNNGLNCENVQGNGDWAHYDYGWHQIVGNGLLEGSDDVYNLEDGKFLQCFCGLNGNGVQTFWFPAEVGIWGKQWNLGEQWYSYENLEYDCGSDSTEVISIPLSSAGAPICTADPLKYTPTVLKALKKGECADIEWSTTDADRYNIYVGPTGKNPKDYWNARDIKGQSFEFCGLPEGIVDVQVCGLNICGAEKCSAIKIDDIL